MSPVEREAEHVAASGLDIVEIVEVVIEFADAEDGPWPTETWGPLHPEHFALRMLDDLDKLPKGGGEPA